MKQFACLAGLLALLAGAATPALAQKTTPTAPAKPAAVKTPAAAPGATPAAKPGTAPALGAPAAGAPAAPGASGAAPGTVRPAQPRVAGKYNGQLPTDPAQYILDVQTMMLTTNNAAAVASGARLKTLWGSNKLTATQQGKIIALSQAMLAKKFRPRPHFELLFNALTGAAGVARLSDAQLDQYLDVLGQTLDKEQPLETEKFLALTSRFFNTGLVYKSGFNGLRATGGTVSFAYSPIQAAESNLEFGAAAPAKKDEAVPDAPKAAPAKAAAKPAAPKPKPVVKKKASSGWDTADLWSSPTGGGWGNDDGWGKADDGWGAPVKKKAPPKKKPVAKAAPAAPAAEKAAAATPKANPADFDGGGWSGGAADAKNGAGGGSAGGGFAPAASYDTYYAPPARGAVLVLKDADLVLSAVGDSVVLRKVSGTVAPSSSRLIASGGQLAWTIKSNPVTAELGPFDFDFAKPEFTAQPVTLTYPYLLQAPVKGALSYKATRRKPGATESSYPRFISLTNDARIKTLGENLDYRGGVSIAGSRLLSAALDGSVAYLTVTAEGKPKFRAGSRAYVLGDSVITATRAAVSLYEGAKDSLCHPGVTFKFLKGKQLLKLGRDEGVFKTTPYQDSFHQLEIQTELLTWNLREPKIEFSIVTAKNQQAAVFESRDFYANPRYQQIKGINRIHPLQALVGYSQAHGKANPINISNLAEGLGVEPANLRSAMQGLTRDGYVGWNGQTGDVTILPKGFHYVAANRDQADYDHIAIKSMSGAGRNATLNLASNELLVRGVERFNFNNDSALVYVQPDSGRVRIGKNRDIAFGGTVVAANMRFRGRDFKFDYNGFYVDMMKIDSIVIRSQAKKKKGAKTAGKYSDFALTNKGKVSTGRLFLNDPQNKSGRKKKLNYPSFDSKTGSNVYFGKQEVLGGAYDSTLVFDIPPFKMDSLNGSGKMATGFDGMFRSGGIIPDLKTRLTTQADGSLGFEYAVPKEGFPLYKTKGRVYNKVRLDAKGLQADGKVEYQSGTFTSDGFVFYKDSVVAVGKAGTVAARKADGVDVPKMLLPEGYLMHWEVKTDSMFLATPPEGGAVRLYTSATETAPAAKAVKGRRAPAPAGPAGYTFTGTALLTARGAGGNGRLDGPQSYVKSPELTFKSDSYSGRRAALSVKSAEAGKPALTANDVTFDYDMKKGYADFTREEGSRASIDLPYAQFKTTLSGGRWDFKKKTVRMRLAPGADSSKSYFYSTNPEQQGLRFKAATGVYDLARYSVEAGGVPYVASADAWIIPDSGRVSVLARGQLKPFRKAKVVLDSLAKFHYLTKGTIRVFSKKAFGGDAYYSFKTEKDSVAIHFVNFEPDPAGLLTMGAKGGKAAKKRAADREAAEAAGRNLEPDPGTPTIATAVVEAKQNFLLAPRIGYRGNIKLNSQRRGLIFDGEVQLQFGKDRAKAEWFAVKDSIDPKNIALNLKDLKGADGVPLLTGLFVSNADNKVFPLYVAAVPDPLDVPVFTADGTLRYDKRRRLFTLSRVDADDPNVYQGAVLTYHDSTNRLGFRGPMSFIKSTKTFGLSGAGTGTANPDSARYRIETLLGFDIALPAKAVEVMGADLEKITKNSAEALNGSSSELYNLGQFVGDKGVESYVARKSAASPNLGSLSNKLLHTLLLGKATLRWSNKHKAWYSEGPLGLNGVGKKSMNAAITGYVEIKHDNAQDEVSIYLEPEPQSWYYLHYANGTLLTKSSNENYDAQIGAKQKGNIETATEWGVFLGDFPEVDAFRAQFQRNYLGGNGKLAARPPAPVKEDVPTDGKKKKKKAADIFGDGAIDDPNAAPATDPATDPAKAKKAKKGKANDPFADAPMDDPNAPPAEAKAKKSKKELAAEAAAAAEAAGTAPAPDPAAAAKQAAKEAELAKKEAAQAAKDAAKAKKAKANDPFADAPMDDPNAEPAEDKAKKGKKEKVADAPVAAPGTTPAADSAKTQAADPAKAAATAAATAAAAAKAAATADAEAAKAAAQTAAAAAKEDQKAAAQAAKEAADAAKAAAKEAEKQAKEAEKLKKEEEKKKKAAANDPFGG